MQQLNNYLDCGMEQRSSKTDEIKKALNAKSYEKRTIGDVFSLALVSDPERHEELGIELEKKIMKIVSISMNLIDRKLSHESEQSKTLIVSTLSETL